MSKKIDAEVQAIVDYILQVVDVDIDKEDSMEKLVLAKTIDSAAKMMAIQKTEINTKEFARLADEIESLKYNQMADNNQLMRQALMIVASIVPEDNKKDILDIAKKMAGKETNIHTGDKTTQNVQSGAVGQIGENNVEQG